MNKNSEETYMTRNEAAIRLQVSMKTIDRMIARGDLKIIKIGQLVRIPRSSFNALNPGGVV